jgi:hypothetical protein
MQSPIDMENGGSASLEGILAPLSLDQFMAGPFGRTPIHLPGPKGRFRHLLDWDALARLLECTPLDAPQFAVVKAGQTIPSERYLRNEKGRKRIDGGALSLLLDTGASAIINHIDELVPEIARLADEIGDRLGARSTANLYATWRTERGFDAHWDGHDVIVLQLAGRKEWPIYKPVVADAVHNKVLEEVPPASELEQVYTLADGDVLYLPRGWIHAPSPLDEPSLHLTVSITRPTGADFLEWLAAELESDDRVRAALPPVTDEAALARWHEEMCGLVSDAIRSGAVQRFLVHRDADRTARPHFSFPDFGRTPSSQWTPATLLRAGSRHRLPVEILADGTAQVTAAGRSWPCAGHVATALLRLTSTRPLPFESLTAGLEETDFARVRELLGLLAMLGLVETVQAQGGDDHG